MAIRKSNISWKEFKSGGDDPREKTWGDHWQEAKIPKILEKYKDPDSKKRKLRELRGGENKPETDSEKSKIDDIIKGQGNSEYAWELFNDLMGFGRQSQLEMPQNKKNLIEELYKQYGWALKQGRKFAVEGYLPDKVTREAGLRYTPDEGFKYLYGVNLQPDQLAEGILGGVNLRQGLSPYNYEGSRSGFSAHIHPQDARGNPSDPSDEDRENATLWGGNYLMQEGSNDYQKFSKYGKEADLLLRLLYNKHLQTP